MLWKEPTNQVELLEKEVTVLDLEWKKRVAERLLQGEEQREEKKYLLELSSQNDQI